MEDTKNLKQAIVDEHYIDYCLHHQGLGQEDEDDLRDKKKRRRDEGPDGVPADEAVPQVPGLPQDYDPFTEPQRKHVEEFKEAFNHYSRVLQYVLTKVTKGEVY
eukprot:1024085-Amphidinium_carterae.1